MCQLWRMICDLEKLVTPRPPPGCPQGSEGDPEWIFVTLETYLTTFVSETFWFDEIWFWHPQGPPIAPAAPRGQGVIPIAFLSSLKHTWQLLLAKFFDLLKFDFDPPGDPPSDPEPPEVGGQIWIAYAVLSGMKALPYQFGWATISGFRDHSRLTRLRTTEINS